MVTVTIGTDNNKVEFEVEKEYLHKNSIMLNGHMVLGSVANAFGFTKLTYIQGNKHLEVVIIIDRIVLIDKDEDKYIVQLSEDEVEKLETNLKVASDIKTMRFSF